MTQQARSPFTRFGVGLGASFLIIGSLISGYFSSRIINEARDTETWPEANGQLLKAGVAEIGVGRFRTDVSYEYEVNGRNYTGSRVRTSDGEYNVRDGAAQAIQGLQAGMPVTVQYNARNPTESVLQAGAGIQEYALIAIPGIMFVAGLLAFHRAWRKNSATDRNHA